MKKQLDNEKTPAFYERLSRDGERFRQKKYAIWQEIFPKRTRFKKEGVKRLSWLPQSAEAASGTLALPARSARGCR